MKDPRAQRIQGLESTVFSEFSALAKRHQAINLGQGFPDFDGSSEILEAAIAAIRKGENQYAEGPGNSVLRAAVASHAERFYGMNVDSNSMVTITSGATEAIADSMLATLNPGDEVVIFEPFFDSYVASVALAQGVPRFVPLYPPDREHEHWWFNPEALKAAFGRRTRMVMVNSPHNPTGKVFNRKELELIGELCQRHDALALCDEVYEHLVFPPAEHIPLATLPGMRERTITVGSGGKTFSVTGWKVGWAIASPKLRAAVQSVHQYVTFSTPAPFQLAIAKGLELPDTYFTQTQKAFRERQAQLTAALTSVGLPVLPAEGGYFVIAQSAGWNIEDDFHFCRHLTEAVGVTPIPVSALYSPPRRAMGRGLVRFAFCKKEQTLSEAARRLSKGAPGSAFSIQ